jgi:hypothetical protein
MPCWQADEGEQNSLAYDSERRRYYMPRAGVNAFSGRRKQQFVIACARLDTALLDTYTLPFALDGSKTGF